MNNANTRYLIVIAKNAQDRLRHRCHCHQALRYWISQTTCRIISRQSRLLILRRRVFIFFFFFPLPTDHHRARRRAPKERRRTWRESHARRSHPFVDAVHSSESASRHDDECRRRAALFAREDRRYVRPPTSRPSAVEYDAAPSSAQRIVLLLTINRGHRETRAATSVGRNESRGASYCDIMSSISAQGVVERASAELTKRINGLGLRTSKHHGRW